MIFVTVLCYHQPRDLQRIKENNQWSAVTIQSVRDISDFCSIALLLQCDGKSKLNSWDWAGGKQIRAPVSSLCLSIKFINNRTGSVSALIRNPNLKCITVIRLSTESTTRKNLEIKIEPGSSCYMLLFLFLPSPPLLTPLPIMYVRVPVQPAPPLEMG